VLRHAPFQYFAVTLPLLIGNGFSTIALLGHEVDSSFFDMVDTRQSYVITRWVESRLGSRGRRDPHDFNVVAAGWGRAEFRQSKMGWKPES
jgi:hypothetical protein